jgi:cell division protein FtsQ
MVNSYGEVFEANVGEVDDDKMPRLRGPDTQSQQVLAMYLRLGTGVCGLTLPLESLGIDRARQLARTRGAWCRD